METTLSAELSGVMPDNSRMPIWPSPGSPCRQCPGHFMFVTGRRRHHERRCRNDVIEGGRTPTR